MKTDDMPIIELSGTARERGHIYGETAKTLIAEVVESWRMDLGNYCKNSKTAKTINPDIYLNEFFTKTDYLTAIKKLAPRLLEEVQGIAEGSGQTFEHILGLQLIDEEWTFGLRRGLAKPVTKCSAFGIAHQGSQVSYSGQNMDISSWVDGKQVLLRIMSTESTPEILVFAKAGNIGLNGLNASGLGITCNTLPQLNYSTKGLPVAFIVRSILQKQSINEAEEFLCNITHASGQNYILSSPSDMRCFECCGTSVARHKPDDAQGRVFHTNHPLVNQDTCYILPPEKMRSKNSVARFDSIYKRLSDTSRVLVLDDIKAALAAHDDPENPVSRNNNYQGSSIGFTAGSSIYEFSNSPKLHLAAGPPCETEYKVFEFST